MLDIMYMLFFGAYIVAPLKPESRGKYPTKCDPVRQLEVNHRTCNSFLHLLKPLPPSTSLQPWGPYAIKHMRCDPFVLLICML